jgi:hypothetical protein
MRAKHVRVGVGPEEVAKRLVVQLHDRLAAIAGSAFVVPAGWYWAG